MPTQVLADPNGRVVIADGRNHLELVDEHFDIIVTDPPPPIQSSGVSVISSLEYYEAGRDHLTDGGVMMQWTPYGTTDVRPEGAHPDVRQRVPARHRRPGIRRLRLLHAGLDAADVPGSRRGRVRAGATRRPRGHLERVRLAGVDRRRLARRRSIGQTWLIGDQVRAYAGTGPLITDDEPRPEYFLLRRAERRRVDDPFFSLDRTPAGRR